MSEIQVHKLPIEFCTTAGKTVGEATERPADQAAAVQKGLTAFGIFWGLAMVAIPIPLVHFFAVPLFLLLGPVAGLVVYKLLLSSSEIENCSGSCAACGQVIQFVPTTKQWPLQMRCPKCNIEIFITKN